MYCTCVRHGAEEECGRHAGALSVRSVKGRHAQRPLRGDRCPPAAAGHRPQDPGRRSHSGLHQGTATTSPQWGSPHVHTGTQQNKNNILGIPAPGHLLFLGYTQAKGGRASSETCPVSHVPSRPRAAATAELPVTVHRAGETEERAGQKAQPAAACPPRRGAPRPRTASAPEMGNAAG